MAMRVHSHSRVVVSYDVLASRPKQLQAGNKCSRTRRGLNTTYENGTCHLRLRECKAVPLKAVLATGVHAL
eukprot:6177265-Pleurochrysis_carterae.AAC.3